MNTSASMDPTAPERTVVAGIIKDDLGRCLVTRRSAGQKGAGLWEFPGGKVEPGESEREALARELAEELGLEVVAARPLPHWRAQDPPGIRLSFWAVEDYTGAAHPREGQAMRWCTTEALSELTFLPPDRPIVARLSLPAYYLISNAEALGEAAFLSRLEGILRAHKGALVQLREPWDRQRLSALASRVKTVCRHFGGKLLLNAASDPVDPAADGIHLPAARLLSLSARPVPAPYLVAASCHNARELTHAWRVGCDFAVLSPVKPTASHPGAPVLGWEEFSGIIAATPLPVYALGGMHWDDLARSREAGAQGVALRGAAFGSSF